MFDFLLPSQHFRCEGFDFLPRYGFFFCLESVFQGWIFEFYLSSQCFVVKFHALSFGLMRSHENSLVSCELKSIYIYIYIYIYNIYIEREVGSKENDIYLK